jgi:hypothetical protein
MSATGSVLQLLSKLQCMFCLWADAGGVGVAVGPSHVLHSVSTVLAVYTVEAASGSQGGVQDLCTAGPVRACWGSKLQVRNKNNN